MNTNFKKINNESDLPENNKEVIVKHKYWGINIARIKDGNGKNGYTEWINNAGYISKMPNKTFPDNIDVIINGHYCKLSDIDSWCEIPE